MTITPEQVLEFSRLQAGGMPLRKIMRAMGVGYESAKAMEARLAAGGCVDSSDGEKTRGGAVPAAGGALVDEGVVPKNEKNAGGFPAAGTVVRVQVVRGRGIQNTRVVLGTVVGEKWPVAPATVRVRSNAPYTPKDFRGQPFVFEARVEGDGNLAELQSPRSAGRPWPLTEKTAPKGNQP
jgi:hypothetical protein